MVAFGFPTGVPEHEGEMIRPVDLGRWMASPGEEYSHDLSASNGPLLKEWVAANHGVLNIEIAAVGSKSARYTDLPTRVASTGSRMAVTPYSSGQSSRTRMPRGWR
ncbi:MAG: hypothetical protein ACRDRL_32675, partial [Sciscionella sp.]